MSRPRSRLSRPRKTPNAERSCCDAALRDKPKQDFVRDRERLPPTRRRRFHPFHYSARDSALQIRHLLNRPLKPCRQSYLSNSFSNVVFLIDLVKKQRGIAFLGQMKSGLMKSKRDPTILFF